MTMAEQEPDMRPKRDKNGHFVYDQNGELVYEDYNQTERGKMFAAREDRARAYGDGNEIISADEAAAADPPEGYTEQEWNRLNWQQRRDILLDPSTAKPQSTRTDNDQTRLTENINRTFKDTGKYPQDVQRQMDAAGDPWGARGGAAPRYASQNAPMAMDDPRRGGNVAGMDYSQLHNPPPRMAMPQGRNSQLPAYGSWGYNQPAPQAPMPMSPQGYARTNMQPGVMPMSPQGYGAPYTTDQMRAMSQSPAPGTRGAPNAVTAVSNPAAATTRENPAQVAQQQVLAQMALGQQGRGTPPPSNASSQMPVPEQQFRRPWDR